MLLCGLKLTHDAAVAIVEVGNGRARLVFSDELEKIANGPRHAAVTDLATVVDMLGRRGLEVDDVDRFVVDGWGRGPGPWTLWQQTGRELPIAGYHEDEHDDQWVYEPYRFAGMDLAGTPTEYVSYRHVADHVSSAYATSPFSARGEDAYVLVWDGGIAPRLYAVDGGRGVATFCGELFPMIGHAYGSFAAHFEPFRSQATVAEFDGPGENFDAEPDAEGGPPPALAHNLGVPGKVMAYAALGEPVPELVAALRSRVLGHGALRSAEVASLCSTAAAFVGRHPETTSADLFASIGAMVGDLLVDRLGAMLSRLGPVPARLCYAGGCALNIKWNSRLRASGLFEEIWVPPFPNDSGSAIGAITSHLAASGGPTTLSWDVYSGPALGADGPSPGWAGVECSPGDLGRFLAESGQPVVMLNGGAELGPRALGNRSILASPIDAGMRDELNRVKRREDYRPVSPICLEEEAAAIFDPGGSEPYMLFEHFVRPAWSDRVAAATHLDGSARLQTVSPRSNPVVHEVISSFGAVTGVPVLCNTSANLPGRGFLPDLASATAWGEVAHVWAGGRLYRRPGQDDEGGRRRSRSATMR